MIVYIRTKHFPSRTYIYVLNTLRVKYTMELKYGSAIQITTKHQVNTAPAWPALDYIRSAVAEKRWLCPQPAHVSTGSICLMMQGSWSWRVENKDCYNVIVKATILYPWTFDRILQNCKTVHYEVKVRKYDSHVENICIEKFTAYKTDRNISDTNGSTSIHHYKWCYVMY